MTQSGDWHEVRARHDNGTRDTFAVRMTNGEELIATSEHKILTARGWVAVCDLTRSDLVQQVWVATRRSQTATTGTGSSASRSPTAICAAPRRRSPAFPRVCRE